MLRYVHVDDGGKVLWVSVEEEDGRGARSVLVTQLFNTKAAQPFPVHNYANSARRNIQRYTAAIQKE